MEAINIFEYESIHAYLVDCYKVKKDRNTQFSIRSWAQSLNLSGHATLSRYLKGNTKVQLQHIPHFSKNLNLRKKEAQYFEVLVMISYAKTESEKNYFIKKLIELRPYKKEDFLNFDFISDWINTAIIEMTSLKDFRLESSWIKEKLHFDVPEERIQRSIRHLINNKLIERNKDKIEKIYPRLTSINNNAKNKSIRKYHKQVLELAKTSIENQETSKRYLNSCTMTIKEENLPKAQEAILEFREKMACLLEEQSGDKTYQLNVQFFSLTL